ncbi:MAG: hypothetical protein LAP86_33780 [Acidobacteriia bacterium]|nr:hypothetical protein [Terriglobia bacterium]
MADIRVRSDSRRRSTRVVLKIVISVEGVNEPLMCDGETIVVNRHGALISASVPLRIELKIKIQVVLTGMRADARVVHVDPERPQVCGIALEKPENIWDLPRPPDDWRENAHEF